MANRALCRAQEKDHIPVEEIPVIAAMGASTLTRAAAHIAFGEQGRGLLTSDILGHIGHAYENCIGSEGEKGWKGKF